MRVMNEKLILRRSILILALVLGVVWFVHGWGSGLESRSLGSSVSILDRDQMRRRQAACFVPNLGQWDHAAKFVHRSGLMTLFLKGRGWVVDLRERPDQRGNRAVALQMTFEGDARVPQLIGEEKSSAHHNYFLGNEENRWHTGVPLFGSVRYENLYPGIDVRLRDANGVPEYDLLLKPGADLAAVDVHVEGARGLSIASDGSLVIDTALGLLLQTVPRTWQVDVAGERQEVVCHFTLLDTDRYGFEVPGWDGDTSLTIDPGLIWSTFLGGYDGDAAKAVAVDARGVVTVAGFTAAGTFPTTPGAYDRTRNGGSWIFISRLDPTRRGATQLAYSTYLGGTALDSVNALTVDPTGVVTVVGVTYSSDFPTTKGAYDSTYAGTKMYPGDAFVTRLDPTKIGASQLAYSTYLGAFFWDEAKAVAVDAGGVVTVAGWCGGKGFPTTRGAYDTTFAFGDAFVSQLDPRRIGAAQLVYSTYLGGSSTDYAHALAVDARGVVTVAGWSSSTDFPTTRGAYDSNLGGINDAFVSRLDPSKVGAAQLVYSTYLGGRAGSGGSSDRDIIHSLAVDSRGVVAVAGETWSLDFPTTSGAFDTTHNLGTPYGGDAFVSRLDPSKTGVAQLVYSTFLGGKDYERVNAIAVDDGGVVTVAGATHSTDFPTTRDAFDTTYGGPIINRYPGDGFVTRLDTNKTGAAQLIYSTYLGGNTLDSCHALSLDASGVVTVAGETDSANFPATRGAYDTIFNGVPLFFFSDAFVSRLDMGVALYGDVHEISIKAGGTQKLTVNAGKAHAGRSYWIFGSVTGTTPGLSLLGVHIPLNPDLYTNIAMAHVNTTAFTRFRGTLDANGLAAPSFVVPANLPLPVGFTFYHAYVVYDASGKFYLSSNPVPLTLIK
jgi:hypothetical protein